MKVRPEDYPEGSPARIQIERALVGAEMMNPRPRRDRTEYPEQALQREIVTEADGTPAVLLLDRAWWPPEVTGETLGRWMYHVPNGGARNAAEAAILIGLGVRPGVFDLCLWLPVHRVLDDGTDQYRGGLYMELKAGRNDLTAAQKYFGTRARLVAYDTAEIRSIHEFRAAVAAYFKGARPLWK